MDVALPLEAKLNIMPHVLELSHDGLEIQLYKGTIVLQPAVTEHSKPRMRIIKKMSKIQ